MSDSPVQDIIEKKLNASFHPVLLEIINESDKHKGHSHHKGGVPEETGETHFRVKIVSAFFEGMKPKDRHQAVHHVLAQEMRRQIHALSLDAKAPHE